MHAAKTPLCSVDSSPHPFVIAPTACTRIILVGAGGFGREALHWARDAWPSTACRVAGFLSADPRPFEGRDCPLPILADPASFQPEPGDGLLLAIGIPGVRRSVTEDLLSRGARFLTLIHPTAIVAPTADIGSGSIVCPHAIVSDSARLGRFTLLNYKSSVAHDATTGDYAVLSPYATMAGNAMLGNDVFLGLHASVGPCVRIGAGSKVVANSCALTNVPDDAIVHGVPGRIGPLLK